jgi:hypothetical protein
MSEAPGFLARWSRRKRGLAPTAAPPPPAQVRAPQPAPLHEAAEEATPAPAIDPAALAAIEGATDLAALRDALGPQVSPLLRQAALRRLWALDPAIRDFVGPADYAWDFNAPDGVPGFAISLSGEVGRLLAQAIGAIDAPVEAPVEAPKVAEPAPPAMPAVAIVAPAPPASPTVLLAADEPAGPARQRHGGAVPA